MAAATLAFAGAAGAQATVATEYGNYQLLGCYAQNKQVACDITFTLTGENKKDVYHQVTVFSANGAEVRPSEFVYAGKPHKGTVVMPGGTVYKDIPVKLTIMTGLPTTSTSLRALILNNGDVRWDNIAVRGAAAPAPVAAPAPAPVDIAGSLTATLTNCKQSGATIVCTATLRR